MPDLRRGPRVLTGWGSTAPSAATVVQPTYDDVAELIARAGPRGVLARGLGRSYGDAAQNAGGLVLEPLPPRIELLEGGVVRASAGTSLHDLIRTILPAGWFVPVTPGTRYVTLGGAVACDVHGKNHHRAGTFGSHVRSLELILADGSRRRLSPDDADPSIREQFWATVGGMGLTGVIAEVTLSCIPVTSGHMVVDTERATDLGTTMERLREADRSHTYTVAWLDMTARGRHLGRSVITLGEHAEWDQLPRALRGEGTVLPHDPRLDLPLTPPISLVNRLSARLFNEAWFHKAPRRRAGELQSMAAFFHPLDGVAHWNRVYGSRGLVQYQCVLPDSSEGVLGSILQRFAESGAAGFLSVLKRFGPANPSPLSFPVPGWTLAVDVPASPGLAPLLDELDQTVLEAGGRIYLAKDSRAGAGTIRQMYPRLGEFQVIRESMDPSGVFQSDLARRLGL